MQYLQNEEKPKSSQTVSDSLIMMKHNRGRLWLAGWLGLSIFWVIVLKMFGGGERFLMLTLLVITIFLVTKILLYPFRRFIIWVSALVLSFLVQMLITQFGWFERSFEIQDVWAYLLGFAVVVVIEQADHSHRPQKLTTPRDLIFQAFNRFVNYLTYGISFVICNLGRNRTKFETASDRYKLNEKAWCDQQITTSTGFIEKQRFTECLLYGAFGRKQLQGDYNGCGWIAIHNALVILNQSPIQLATIIYWLECNHKMALNGVLGTYPKSVAYYFNSQTSFQTSYFRGVMTIPELEKAVQQAECATITFQWNGDLMSQARMHTIAIQWKNNRYVLHNMHASELTVLSLDEAFGKERSAKIPFACVLINRIT